MERVSPERWARYRKDIEKAQDIFNRGTRLRFEGWRIWREGYALRETGRKIYRVDSHDKLLEGMKIRKEGEETQQLALYLGTQARKKCLYYVGRKSGWHKTFRIDWKTGEVRPR